MSKFLKAVDKIGVAEVGRRVGVSTQQVWNWKRDRRVPVKHCAAVEAALEGMCSKRDLRPGDWAQIWPTEERAA